MSWNLPSPADADKRTITDIALVIAQLTKCQETWRDGLKGFNVNESTLMREVRLQATAEIAQDRLLRVLRTRFTEPLSAELLDRIQSRSQPEELSRWFDLALTAPSLPFFTASLGE